MLAEYQKGKAADVFTMLDGLKLAVDDLLAVRLAARRNGIGFIATPFSLESVTTLKHLDVDAVKIASPDAVNTLLLDAAASLGWPLFISTGTARLNELGYAAGLVRDRNLGGCMLQCVSAYPTPSDCASLAGLIAIADRFRVPVGYSDHTTDTLCGSLAVVACVIEKHLTYDRSAPGPDHTASFDPRTFSEYIALIRRATAMLGSRHKQVHPVEADVRTVARQSLCLQRDLPAGHVLSREDLTIKRPGTAIPAAHLDLTIGRKLLRPVKGNDLLSKSDLVRSETRESRGHSSPLRRGACPDSVGVGSSLLQTPAASSTSSHMRLTSSSSQSSPTKQSGARPGPMSMPWRSCIDWRKNL